METNKDYSKSEYALMLFEGCVKECSAYAIAKHLDEMHSPEFEFVLNALVAMGED